MPRSPKEKSDDAKPKKASANTKNTASRAGGEPASAGRPAASKRAKESGRKSKPVEPAPPPVVEAPEPAAEPKAIESPAAAEATAPPESRPAPAEGATAPPQQSQGFARRKKPPKPTLPKGTQEIIIARAKYTVVDLVDSIEVSRPRKRDPKNPRTYRFSLKGCEVARKHLAGRRVTLADAANLLKMVKVHELDGLDGEARRQATKFLLVALASRVEAQLERDGDLILVHVPFNAADLM